MKKLFGTDGVRGIALTELTCELSMKIGRATATVLKNRQKRCDKILIGCDTRISSDALVNSIVTGIRSVGTDALIAGVLSTPAVAYLVKKYGADAGIMVSASHNPSEYNGIKIFSSDGFKLSDSLEVQIEEMVHSENISSENLTLTGKTTRLAEAGDDYIRHLKSTVEKFDFSGLSVAFDCANGSASYTAQNLFDSSGANTSFLSKNPDGININNNCGSTHMKALKDFVLKNKCDVGFAFDGDADRCLCIDENGDLVDGDFIMAVCAAELKSKNKLKNNTVVGTVMSNFGFSKFCKENDINFIAAKVGDRFVLEEMLAGGHVLGGEQSGHVIFKDFASTGDGQLTAIQILSIMKNSGKKLSELTSVMTRYPQVLINLHAEADVKSKFNRSQTIQKYIDDLSELLSENGRILVRTSGTEPLIRIMVEGNDDLLIHRIAENISVKIKELLFK